MRAISIFIAATAVYVAFTTGAEAKGCLKGAAVGGVVGHVAGHHAVLGAAAGCVVEHHREKVRDQQAVRPPPLLPAAPPPAMPATAV